MILAVTRCCGVDIHFRIKLLVRSRDVMYAILVILVTSGIPKPPSFVGREIRSRSSSLTALFSNKDGINRFQIIFSNGLSMLLMSGIVLRK